MAVLEEKKFAEELSKKKLHRLYYLYGEEPFKMDAAVEKLRALLAKKTGEEFQWDVYFGDEVKADQLCDASNNFSLWQKQKGVLIKNAESIPAKQWEGLRSLIDDPSENTTVIFCASKVDARTKAIQWITKAGEEVVLVHFHPAEAWELQQYAKTFAKEAGKELSPGANDLLLEWSGHSLYELKQSIEKAALFSPASPAIEEEHVRAVDVRTRPESIFLYTDALLSRNRKGALEQLETILRQGEDPIAILGLIARQYRWLLQILALKAEGKNEASIGSELRLFPRQAKALLRSAQNQGVYTVIRSLKAIVEADKTMKSTREPLKNVLERLTLNLMQ